MSETDFYSTDLSFREREIAEAVVQPQSTDELSSVVSLAHQAGLNVVPRGGNVLHQRLHAGQGSNHSH